MLIKMSILVSGVLCEFFSFHGRLIAEKGILQVANAFFIAIHFAVLLIAVGTCSHISHI